MAKKMVETLEENVKEAKEEKTTEKKTPAKKAAAKKTTKKDEIKEEVKEETENSDADDAEAQEAKFWEKIEGILAIAKKKKNVLDYQEIMTYFQDTDFEADRMEKVFEILELKKVDVRMNDVPDACRSWRFWNMNRCARTARFASAGRRARSCAPRPRRRRRPSAAS